MNLVELNRTSRAPRALRLLPVALVVATLISVAVIADSPIASSSFVGAEDPLYENGAWVTITAFSPYGTQFQKNNGALADRLSALNHAASRTTAVVPTDHYSEIVVGHIGTTANNVGPIVRVQTSGAAADSNYLWWASIAGGGNFLYRLDAGVPDSTRGTSYTANNLMTTSPVVDGDTLRLIARGQVIYGLKNGVRDFIYNTGTNPTKYPSGTTGIMAYADGAVTNAVISSWSTGPAPVSSGTWTSSTFAGTESPLDEGDRWYPLPGYAGFKKAGGQVIGLASGHNASGVWSITPPANQYSEVTLGAVPSGGGGPIVRIDRNNPGQTGWLLFLYADSPSSSGIYKMTPDGSFNQVQLFTPTLVAGDKWRLTATGNTLTVYQNGELQLTYTTDGSYPTGDVGIEAYTPAFTFSGWQGGDTAAGTAPTITSFTPASGPVGTSVTIDGTGLTGATAVTFNSVSASFTATSDTAIQATVPAGAATGPVSVTTPGGTATSSNNFTVVSPPTITGLSPTSGPLGTSVTINGTGLTGATSVTFNSVSASFTLTSDTAIQATVPAGATTGLVSVTTPGGTATSANNFTVVSAPTISNFSPTAGPLGTSVTISGTNFTGATAVTFNGVSAAFTVNSPTAIQATVPAGATTGPVSVTTPGGTATSTSSFAVRNPPSITNFSPTAGPLGSNVTISGTNFGGATSVTFGGVSAAFGVNSSTTIQATVPAGATTGPVTVTTPGGTATSTNNFTVTDALTVAKLGTGSGTVISNSNPSSPTQINCGPTCSVTYDSSTLVTLTATPAAGSSYTAWAGCDSVSGATCTATMSTARSVAVTFTVQTFTLTVNKASLLGLGNGTVTSVSSPASPAQINCGSTCSVSYGYGTVVTLTATPYVLSAFEGWQGCDSVSGATCTVTVTAARVVTAKFLP